MHEIDQWQFGKDESESERGREKQSESERRKDERLREYKRGRESRDLAVSDKRGNRKEIFFIKKKITIPIGAVPNYLSMQFFLAFRTCDIRGFFGVLCAKC